MSTLVGLALENVAHVCEIWGGFASPPPFGHQTLVGVHRRHALALLLEHAIELGRR